MKGFTISVTALVVALTAVASSAAQAEGRWIPGTPYMVSESDMSDLLEKTWDSAYCQGVPRFGTQGEFPYEEFIVFDCTIVQRGASDLYCSDVRYRSVKSTRRGWFKSKRIFNGRCF